MAALPEGPQHIVVLCGCPLIFPAIPTAEAILGGGSAAGCRANGRGACRTGGLRTACLLPPSRTWSSVARRE